MIYDWQPVDECGNSRLTGDNRQRETGRNVVRGTDSYSLLSRTSVEEFDFSGFKRVLRTDHAQFAASYELLDYV